MKTEVEQAKELLKNIRHVAMATVNADGSPHNTPLFFIHNPELTKVFWGSHKDSLHSRNIVNNDQVFIVLFDSFEQGKGGIYIIANKAKELSGDELKEALDVHNQFREKYSKKPLEENYYKNTTQRMYSAQVVRIEIYSAERDEKGRIKKEVRVPIEASKLIGAQ